MKTIHIVFQRTHKDYQSSFPNTNNTPNLLEDDNNILHPRVINQGYHGIYFLTNVFMSICHTTKETSQKQAQTMRQRQLERKVYLQIEAKIPIKI